MGIEFPAGINNCSREAPRLGYARIRYFNQVGITGHPVCHRCAYDSHLRGSIASTAVTNPVYSGCMAVEG